jgi:hypothetical protein
LQNGEIPLLPKIAYELSSTPFSKGLNSGSRQQLSWPKQTVSGGSSVHSVALHLPIFPSIEIKYNIITLLPLRFFKEGIEIDVTVFHTFLL